MTKRVRYHIKGLVQGLGFRPFVYRIARRYGLTGWVQNSAQGVFVEVQGSFRSLEQFDHDLHHEKPPFALYHEINRQQAKTLNDASFVIKKSRQGGQQSALILPDIATCDACKKEIFDSENHRYLYPFTNCTHCGPRYSIIEEMPYDRRNTSMHGFAMCSSCRHEYEDPQDRRFHAQPNACPDCGPHMELWDKQGHIKARDHEAMLQGAQALREGQIIALKGLGGFQILADALSETTVQSLRRRKQRPRKPFALMAPLSQLAELVYYNETELSLLQSHHAPIVLLPRKRNNKFTIAYSVAFNNPTLGVMLPYTPIHEILVHLIDQPFVATSGNLANEPIVTDEQEALSYLGAIADLFLVHNRPIVRAVDDSVARVVDSKTMLIRRARGYAPFPVTAQTATGAALGADLKNTLAFAYGHHIVISQHIGDLANEKTHHAFTRTFGDLKRLLRLSPATIVHDLHPDYLSSQYAKQLPGDKVAVQHHKAHAASCCGEHSIGQEALVFAWDGTGLGEDGFIWGGEVFDKKDGVHKYERIYHLRPFPLPGGEAAIRDPKRTALGLLAQMYRLPQQTNSLQGSKDSLPAEFYSWIKQNFSKNQLSLLQQMLLRGTNTPFTTSMGRLFDGIASLLGICPMVTFEGEAAMELEFAMESAISDRAPLSPPYPKSFYPVSIKENIIDWEPLITGLVQDLPQLATSAISQKFHDTLVEIISQIAQKEQKEHVCLSGGVFQNHYLLTQTIARLRQNGFAVYWNQQVPTNDGGISLGQLLLGEEKSP